MGTVRRYGPRLVKPQVSPTVDLGSGDSKQFEAFAQFFGTANKFLEPAVIQEQTARGEQELLEDTSSFPEWQLKEKPSEEVASAISTAARQHGVPDGAMMLTAYLESTWNPIAQNPESSAGGLFQQIDKNANAYGVADRMDPYQSADGAARFMRDNISYLSAKLGRAPSTGEIYLAHQQGPGGAVALLSAPPATLAADVVGREAVELNGGDPDKTTTREFANIWINKAEREGKRLGISLAMPDTPEYELEQINRNSFEPRRPFTIRDAAFNRAADRVITARATAAMNNAITAAISVAGDDLGKLQSELDRAQEQIMAELPAELPGLATEIASQFELNKAVASRSVIALKERKVRAQQEAAVGEATRAVRSGAERMALSGAGPEELAAHMGSATDMIAQYGPREEFSIGGKVYPADPSRAGMLSADGIATEMAKIGHDARRLMIEADFMRSDAPGQFVDEFRAQMLAGESPLPGAQSLQLLQKMQGQVNAAESRRRTAAAAEKKRLDEAMDTTINAYVSMTEAGVPVAIPQAERERILETLAPYPDLQREAEIEFAVADAQVATHGMSGPELLGYVEGMREDMREALSRGELDFGKAQAIIELEDVIKKAKDAITAETVGLSAVDSLLESGFTVDEINWDGMIEQAAGDPDLIAEIAETKLFYQEINSLTGMSAEQREAVIELQRARLARLAAHGEGVGTGAVYMNQVLDRLESWSAHREAMAEDDPLRFARAEGLDMPTFEGVENVEDIAGVVSERINMIAPRTALEGVEFPVPLSAEEVDLISGVLEEGPASGRASFLAAMFELGDEQAMEVFDRFDMAEPELAAAGKVYAAGNRAAANIILRGARPGKLLDSGPENFVPTRVSTLGEGIAFDFFADLEELDATAIAYARGVAMASEEEGIDAAALRDGYLIATGWQAGKPGNSGRNSQRGGYAESTAGPTVLPPDMTLREFEDIWDGLTNEQVTAFGTNAKRMTARELRNTTAAMVPTDEPGVFIPVNSVGSPFLTRIDGALSLYTIDMGALR